MKKYFSIGEMSKLHNISIETLRHYDRTGILKPEYINEKTGYRYYSTQSFITIDLIKKCKAIGLSLDEIKEIKNDYTSLESILTIIKNQKNIIDKKIDAYFCLGKIMNYLCYSDGKFDSKNKDRMMKTVKMLMI